jgi:6,7-dimethyl-8-ribityllumazine synthase
VEKITVVEGDLVLQEPANFGVVASRFNGFIVQHLVSGCMDILRRHNVSAEHITVVEVPGARELPIAVQRLAASGRFDALIALGAIIRGATPHFDYVADACSTGLAQVSSTHNLPVAFGVLTVDTIEQAIERAGTKAGNKGADAALTAIEMVSLLRKLNS